jgi:HAD superfamily hydrolase (TIGR01509 family)
MGMPNDHPTPTLPAFHAVVFDLDGTLVDTVGVRVAAWMAVFPDFGLHPDPASLAPLMGSDGRLLARMVAELEGRTLEDGLDAEIDRVAGERFGELNRHPAPLPGVTETLAHLDATGVPWAIATSSRPEEAVASVNALGLPSWPLVVDGNDVEHAKPAPDLLWKAAARLAAEPSVVWYVGDARWDMLAAVAAGMVGIGVTTGATSADDLREAGALAVFDGLPSLLEVMRASASGTPLLPR